MPDGPARTEADDQPWMDKEKKALEKAGQLPQE